MFKTTTKLIQNKNKIQNKINNIKNNNLKFSFTPRNNFCSKTNEQLRGRRVLFNVPGSDERKMNKALTLDADIIVFDLEDGVPPNKKIEARELIKTTLNQFFNRFGVNSPNLNTEDGKISNYIERLIRINDTKSELFNGDIEECVLPILSKLDGILIPKVDSSEDLIIFAEKIQNFIDKNKNEYEKKEISIFAAIESAKGIVNLSSICSTSLPSSCNLSALVYASEDLCADMGITRSEGRTELMYTRQALVCHAKANSLDSIDLVCIDYKNSEKLFNEAKEGANWGFDGKQAIHPNQIPVIYSAFRPSDEKINFAKKIIEKYDEFVDKGKGAFEVDGKMIDLPMVKWARKIIKRV